MVYLSSAALFLLFLYHAPMTVFVRGAYDAYAGGWIAVGAALEMARIERTVYISRFPKRAKKADLGFRAVVRIFHGLWQKKCAQAELRLEIGTGDAAATALLCGGCYAAAALIADRASVRIVPVYGATDARYALRGMLRAKTGHIAIAAFAYWREKRRKENGKEAH